MKYLISPLLLLSLACAPKKLQTSHTQASQEHHQALQLHSSRSDSLISQASQSLQQHTLSWEISLQPDPNTHISLKKTSLLTAQESQESRQEHSSEEHSITQQQHSKQHFHSHTHYKKKSPYSLWGVLPIFLLFSALGSLLLRYRNTTTC